MTSSPNCIAELRQGSAMEGEQAEALRQEAAV